MHSIGFISINCNIDLKKMRIKINIILVLIFLSSCTDVFFEFPQPTYLKNIERIPNKFHGSFTAEMGVDYTICQNYFLKDEDTLYVSSENLILKYQGNKLYINLKEEDSDFYELITLSRFNYFGADSLFVNYVRQPDINFIEYKQNYMQVNNIRYSEIADEHILIKDSLTVNQINTFLNWSKSRHFLFTD